jgi:hypothetical protein
MNARNTIPQLRTCVSEAFKELRPGDTLVRGLLESIASAAATGESSAALGSSVSALGRYAVDEFDATHYLNSRVSEILGIYQNIVRAERRRSAKQRLA